MNGVEVDLEADFEVPYKGVTYKMKHVGDPSWSANVINCRCVILYVEPDDFVIDEDIPQDQPLPTVSEPTVSDSIGIFSVVNRDSVTETSIKILSMKEADRLNKVFSDASKDDRYLNKNIAHLEVRLLNFGKVSGAKLTERFVYDCCFNTRSSRTLQKFDVSMLRNYKGSTNTMSFNANMGDGIMGIAQFFARDTSRNVGDTLEAISDKQRAKLQSLLEQKENQIKLERKNKNF